MPESSSTRRAARNSKAVYGPRLRTCDNGSITTIELETRALAGIRERLLTPALIKRFTELLQQELAAAAQAGNAERAMAERAECHEAVGLNGTYEPPHRGLGSGGGDTVRVGGGT